MALKAPFPYFGGKSSIAPMVWSALGDVKHYIEPCFGSGAVLLARPNYRPGDHIETVNDSDGHIANVWRSLKFSPDVVAEWADWPVNHADLSARKRCMIENEKRLLDGLVADPEWHDPKLAGYWIWAASCWIGTGLTSAGDGCGKRPNIGHGGKGVHALGQRPHLSDGGKGVHALGQIPHLGHGGMGVHANNENIREWFRLLSARLRNVRVVCGDWSRVCGGDWQDAMGTVGMFFDPPYGGENRDTDIYHHDSTTIAGDIEAWCLERGGRPSYRIVVAGYVEEYASLVAAGWRTHRWKANGGYAVGKNENRHRETLFMSPYCVSQHQSALFENEHDAN